MTLFLLLLLAAVVLAGVGFAVAGLGYLIAAGAVVFAVDLVLVGFRGARRRRVTR